MYTFGKEADGMSGRADGPQFALGGDTWVLGCAIPPTAVFPELSAANPDAGHEVFGTETGMYADGAGIMNLRFAIGHDEYGYRWLRHNKVGRWWLLSNLLRPPLVRRGGRFLEIRASRGR